MDTLQDSYKIVKELGSGSFGTVWLIQHNDGKLSVIKKVSLLNLSHTEIEKSKREVKILASLKHPNIVAYKVTNYCKYDLFISTVAILLRSFSPLLRSHIRSDGCLCILMAYCEGGDLHQTIRKQNGCLFPEQQIVRWFIQIAMALQYLHQKNILHRDLKTQNLFLTKSGLVKVGDFGISRHLDSTDDMANTVVGTPFYMSPEILAGLPYNQKSDIWSLGCCLFEMLTLRHPFLQARDLGSLIFRVTRGRIGRIPHCYSEEVSNLVSLLLHHKASQRPSATTILGIPFIRNHVGKFLVDTKRVEKRQTNENATESVRRNSVASSSRLELGEKESPRTPQKEGERRRASESLEEMDSLVISGDKMKLDNKGPTGKVETGVRSCHCPRHARGEAESSSGTSSEYGMMRRGSSSKVLEEEDVVDSHQDEATKDEEKPQLFAAKHEKEPPIPSLSEDERPTDSTDAVNSEEETALDGKPESCGACDFGSERDLNSASPEQREKDSRELSSFAVCLNKTLLTEEDTALEMDSLISLKEKMLALRKLLEDTIGGKCLEEVDSILSRGSWKDQKKQLEGIFGKATFDSLSSLIWKIKLCQELLT